MSAEDAGKPNVLLIIVDDLRLELGCYGNGAILALNMDRLAQSGTLFEQTYCQLPVCRASRAYVL